MRLPICRVSKLLNSLKGAATSRRGVLLFAWLLACGCGETVIARDALIDSVAGTGSPENNGDTGPAASINIGDPFGVEIGPDGALYVTEVRNYRVRRLDLSTGNLTTVAGCGRRGYSGDGGPAVDAELNEPYEVRFDIGGDMYIVEMKNHVVRRVDGKTKRISTVAGNGRKGFGGDGGPAIKALFNSPHSIALDKKSALYVADIGNHRIRRIDLSTGVVESMAGNAQRRLPQDGQVARGNPILGPRALFIDGGTLWIALREGHSIWRMDLADGILHHVAGTGQAGFAGDGGRALEAKFNGPKGIAVAKGDVFVVDSENNAVRRIDLRSGLVATVIGGGPQERSGAAHRGEATNTQLNQPHGLCVAPDGTLFIGDTLNHRICRVRTSPQVPQTFYGESTARQETSPGTNSEAKEQVLRHAVFFQFKVSSANEDVDRVVAAFAHFHQKLRIYESYNPGKISAVRTSMTALRIAFCLPLRTRPVAPRICRIRIIRRSAPFCGRISKRFSSSTTGGVHYRCR